MCQNELTQVPKLANSKNRTNLLMDLTENWQKNNPGKVQDYTLLTTICIRLYDKDRIFNF